MNVHVVVVGAGISGLLAAGELQRRSYSVLVIEKARGVGGRMASRRIESAAGTAVFDHGAQYFTARSRRFATLVDEWLAQNVIRRWSDGFASESLQDADGSALLESAPPREFSLLESARPDGHPRYRGQPQMTAVPKYISRELDVRLGQRVTSVDFEDGRWRLLTRSGHGYTASGLILTPPVPQSLALLATKPLDLPQDKKTLLESIEYDPCFAVLALLAQPSLIPAPGGMWPAEEPIAWMADNQQKGLSPVPAVTIHGSRAFSRRHFDDEPDTVAQRLLQAARTWLGSELVGYEIHRWRYSIPCQTHDQPYLAVSMPGPLVFAGDAFAGPRVEGAALSGLAAAEAMHDLLTLGRA